MTTTEILNSVRRKVLETTQDVVTDAVLLEYLNQAYLDVYKRIYPNASITSATVSCVAGVCTQPAAFGTLYGAAYDVYGNAYDEVSIADFDREEFDRAVTVEGGSIKVYPTNITSLTVKHWAKPATLTAVVNPTIDEFFHEPLVYGTLYRTHEDLQDESLAELYRNRFATELTERLEAQSTYEETNQRGGSMFTEQNLII